MRALRRLPSRQRETLVLRFYLDLSDEEIAAHGDQPQHGQVGHAPGTCLAGQDPRGGSMNTLEDKLRASLRQTAEEIPPEGVPPLRLTNGRRVPGLRRASHRFLGPWLAPLAAAAAVAAVIVASVAISGVLHSHRPAGQHDGRAIRPGLAVEDADAADGGAAVVDGPGAAGGFHLVRSLG
jgi:hypothetical protein